MDDEKAAREWLHERRWARIGASKMGHPMPTFVDEAKSLAALIARVRKDEREECAKVCIEHADLNARYAEDARTNGDEAEGQLRAIEANVCAAAIRARHVD